MKKIILLVVFCLSGATASAFYSEDPENPPVNPDDPIRDILEALSINALALIQWYEDNPVNPYSTTVTFDKQEVLGNIYSTAGAKPFDRVPSGMGMSGDHYAVPTGETIRLKGLFQHSVVRINGSIVAETWNNEEIELDWADGDYDDVTFSHCMFNDYSMCYDFPISLEWTPVVIYRVQDVIPAASWAESCGLPWMILVEGSESKACVHVKSLKVDTAEYDPSIPGNYILAKSVAGNLVSVIIDPRDDMTQEWRDLCVNDADLCDEIADGAVWGGYFGAVCVNWPVVWGTAPQDRIGNAIQHALWNAWMVANGIDTAVAEQWANANEVRPGQTGCVAPSVGSPEEMDCRNNELGRAIGAANIGASTQHLYQLIKAAILSSTNATGFIVMFDTRQCTY